MKKQPLLHRIFLLAFGIVAAVQGSSIHAEEEAIPPTRLNAPLGNAAPEPPLQTILDRLGYAIDVTKDEIEAPLFRRASGRPVVHRPLSAYGLLERLDSGWYSPTDDSRPRKQLLWSIADKDNKQDAPPLMKGAKTGFRPSSVFGVWVSTAGFKEETVYTQDALQRFVPRFPLQDKHKVRVYPAKRREGVRKNTYILCWEYSTNNDFQDIVTELVNVKPVTEDRDP